MHAYTVCLPVISHLIYLFILEGVVRVEQWSRRRRSSSFYFCLAYSLYEEDFREVILAIPRGELCSAALKVWCCVLWDLSFLRKNSILEESELCS